MPYCIANGLKQAFLPVLVEAICPNPSRNRKDRFKSLRGLSDTRLVAIRGRDDLRPECCEV